MKVLNIWINARWLYACWLRITFIALCLLILTPASPALYAQQTDSQPAVVAVSEEEQTPLAPFKNESVDRFLTSLPSQWRENAEHYLTPGEILVGVPLGEAESAAARSELASQLMELVPLTPETKQAAPSPDAVQLVESIDLPVAPSRYSVANAANAQERAGVVIQRWRVPIGQEWQAIALLQNHPDLLWAEPNWLVSASPVDESEVDAAANLAAEEAAEPASVNATQNASLNPFTPGPEILYNTNDPLYLDSQWYLQRINASRAWALNQSFLSDPEQRNLTEVVQIAVIDSGIDFSHPEFGGRLLTGKNYVNDGQAPNDDYGHGTHVTGLIAAALNNAAGIGSLAPQALIDPRKVLGSTGTGSISDVVEAIKDAANAGSRIINMSLEVPASTIQSSPGLNQSFQEGVRYAHDRGVLLIAAGGNYYPQPVAYPGAYNEVMAVAALTYSNTHAYYSSTGSKIEIAAPGGEAANRSGIPIYSTWSKAASSKCRDGSYRLIAGGAYCNSEGTSMAAPIVTGVAALIWSLRPNLQAEDIRSILKETATPLNLPPEMVGTGRVDAYAALRRVLPGQLLVSKTFIESELSLGASPYVVNLRIENPSLEPVQWKAELPASTQWITFTNTSLNPNSGVVHYGEPAFLSLLISPALLPTGIHYGELNVTGVKPNAQPLSAKVTVNLAIDASFRHIHLPLVSRNGAIITSASIEPVDFTWETPLTETSRITYTMFDASDISISWPNTFTFPLRGRTYAGFRLFSDGFVGFPAALSTIKTQPNYCLNDGQVLQDAIFGWWANLNPETQGSRVSSFFASDDRFVVEFSDVAAITTADNYRVSFQIVLHRNGDVGLNYLNTPTFEARPPAITVGVVARNGLFSNQLACSTSSQTIGLLPQSQESYLIKTGDLR